MGDLAEIDLIDLIQVICNKGTERVMLSLKNGSSSGSIHFHKGDVIHAQVGPITGEGAIYQLLTWNNANFELIRTTQTPPVTIKIPFKNLLFEAMRLMDEEKGKNIPVHPVNSWSNPAKVAVDEVGLERVLVDLFLILEQSRVQLADKRNRKQPELEIRNLSEQVNTIYAITRKWTNVDDKGATLEEAIIRVGQTFPTAMVAKVENQAISIGSISNFLSTRKGDRNIQNNQNFEIAMGLLNIMAIHLGLLVGLFSTPSTKAEWEEVRNSHLSEIHTIIKENHK